MRSTLCFLLCALAVTAQGADDKKIDFSREILPLLSENCFQCHGPDEANREAGLRLDDKNSVFAELDSGEHGVVASNSADSELYRRLVTDDEDLRMPPADSGKKLSTDQIAKMKRWIDDGAQWGKHWSFQSPVQPKLPAAIDGWTSHNSIDLFIQQRIQLAGMQPQSRASKEALIRRATLDLTGLPPTIKEIDDFLKDNSPNAFESVIDRLLESPAYGEHFARTWLDVARYADTHGLHLDNERSIWPYRDWVIKAFNRNMPFDQFTVQQLAGDLLPEPSLEQRIATGFNRCNVTTSEGGSIDDEYYVRYAVDRVETTSTVWLGLTTGCAACHDHKFDPLTQKEFYQLFSYFFSLTEKAMDGNALLPPPTLKVPTPEQLAKKSELQSQITALNQRIEELYKEVEYTDPAPDAELGELESGDSVWFDDKLPPKARPQGDGPKKWDFVTAPDHPVFSGSNSSRRTGKGLTQHFFTGANPPLEVGNPGKLFAYVYLDPKNPPKAIQLQFNDGNWNHRAYWGEDRCHGAGAKGPSNHHIGDLPEVGKWVRLEVDASVVGLKPASKLNGWAFTQFGGTVHWDKAGVVSMETLPAEQLASLNLWQRYRKKVKSPPLPGPVQKVIDIEATKRNDAQNNQLTRHYLQFVHPETSKLFLPPTKQLGIVKKSIGDLEKKIPATLVMQDRAKPRQAHILERGEYTEKREPVSSAVPEWLMPMPEGAPANRLGLAKWLTDPKHPLVARVTVNRFWQHFFGTGLVKTSEDFGIQGEQPSHPELLDWLALYFIESDWNIKQFHKLIMMSSTYQQSSKVDSKQLSIDPENRLLSRGPRFRLDAEVIRDSALFASGLLVNKLGGKSVRPYQPAGLWKPVGFGGSNTSVFKQDSGEKLYRRSMYTFWKRTSPPPSMTTFDAPDRETCQVRRARTNTPLQALVLMNDIQFIEAARKFAERIESSSDNDEARLAFAYRNIVARQPRATEKRTLLALLAEYKAAFKSDPDAAKKLLSSGDSAASKDDSQYDLAAWTMIAHLILNLSETVTKG